ncbi:glycosyltransferase [Actinoplanes friuliensis]|uniref:Group 1 glycosyl transferase n=1 Tax=Actinoplanes friuliensis DSM 7358 TaxID=1246995 RepID=U5VY90_9ACTN|nr:glycosyltransferase [Actinoplanes friuliensis]AGZ41859.1 group 1 glycosyl transferase [Actinoplanes friuliensis DSM 7358]
MRIAHFSDCEPARADGISASAGLAVALLREAGHHVDDYRPGPFFRGDRPVELRSVPVPGRSVRMAMPWSRAGPPADLVHVHTTGPVGLAGFRLAAKHRIPLVLTWHTDLLAYAEHFPEIPIGAAWCAVRLGLGWSARETLELAHRGRRRHTRLLVLGQAMMAASSLVIAPSAKTAAGLRAFGTLPPVRVLPTPAVLPPDGGEDLRAVLGIPHDAEVVLSVGRVTAEKNPVLLLEAFARVRRLRPYAKLVLLGARQRRRAVRALAGTLGLEDAVLLVPPVPHDRVAAFYRMADVLAFASTTDTQSLVIGEAEAAGLPVVSADPELGRLTCGPGPESFAAAIVRVLDDPGLRDRARAAGLAAARDRSPERYLEQLLAAYAEARSLRG